MKQYIYVAVGLAFLGMAATIVTQCRMMKQEETKQAAIKNPAEKKAEVVERVITRTVTKEGKPIEIVKEVVTTVVEKSPIVPPNPISQRISNYYVSGTYGYRWDEGFGTWGVGAGYNFTDWLSTGIRYDTIGPEQRIAVEVRINF